LVVGYSSLPVGAYMILNGYGAVSGMSIAAGEVEVMDEHLAGMTDVTDPVQQRSMLKRVRNGIYQWAQVPWHMTASNDIRYVTTEHTLSSGVITAYNMLRPVQMLIQRAASIVYLPQFDRVFHLVSGPEAFLSMRFLARVVTALVCGHKRK